MNTNWSKILLFSLLFGILGFVLGRMCGSCHHGGCGREAAMECHGEGHGKGACCKDDHHHAMAGVDTVQVITPATHDTVKVQVVH